jgi:fibronectin type 3 domain-containing protein
MRSRFGVTRACGSQAGRGCRWTLVAVLVAFAVAAADGAIAQECGIWTPVPAGGTATYGVGFGAGKFVVVGTTGAETSPDGVAWTAAPIDLGGGVLERVAWNGTLWVAVGGGGRIYTSPNGTAWTPRSSPTTRELAGIAWGNGTWVVVGDLQTVLTSPDGTTWTQASIDTGGFLTSVIWTGTRFVAVGQPGVVLTSDTGASWSKTTIPGEDWITDVVWNGSLLVVVSWDGTVLTKSVFTAWAVAAETGRALRRLLWTGSKFIAVGDANAIIGSPDAVTWQAETISGSAASGSLTGIAWNGSRAVVVGAPTGVLRNDCGIWADFTINPAGAQIGQSLTVSATKVQGIGRVRWDFGEVGCDGGAPVQELVCLGNPCTFATTFAYAAAGTKTIALLGWNGALDGDGNRVFVVVKRHTLSVAATGTCSTCGSPGAPTAPNPAAGAVRPGGSVLLQWSPPATGTPPFTYDVVLDGGTLCSNVAVTQCQAAGVGESSTVHTWQVTVKNACGQATSLPWTFLACSAPALPVADFDWLPAGPLPSWPAQPQPFVGQQVTLHDRSTNAPTDWAWSGLAAAGLLAGNQQQATWWSPGGRTVGVRAENCLGWSEEKTRGVPVSADVRPRLWAFDLGTDGSPVAAGFTRVTAGTTYSAALGYGWQAGVVSARDRASGDDLVRDFVFTQNATFGVDVPSRTYDVVLWLGDTTRAHDQMAVYLGGEQVDLISTEAGAVVQRVYRVNVADGHLAVRVADLGGADPNAVVNGIEMIAADTVRVDFGTGASPVAAGYTRASEGTTFAAPSWCGWSAGKIASRDRAVGSDLLRDFDFTTDGTLSCAVAPGVWNVAVTMGDASSPHDQMGVFLQGVQVDNVARGAGQYANRQYRVRINVPPLALRLDDLGGVDANAVINSLEIARVGPFDFGTATSPVAAGYVGVSNATRYSSATGFGWLEGSVGSRDRAVGSDALRDFDMTTGATFAVDVPNGAYEVTVVTGDATTAHDQMAIVLEGAEAAVVGVAKGKSLSRTWRTTVADGQLSVRIEDRGGSDPNAVINVLALAPAR